MQMVATKITQNTRLFNIITCCRSETGKCTIQRQVCHNASSSNVKNWFISIHQAKSNRLVNWTG